MPAGAWTRWTPGTRPRMCGPSCPGPTSSSTLLRRGCSGCSGCTPALTSAPLPRPAWPACRWTKARRRLGELTRARLLAEHVPGRFWCHDLLRAYAAELTPSADSEAERRTATGRMLDHYLHTAHSAALQLHPTRKPITLAPLQPGAEPEHIGDAGQALAWFEAEHRVLMAAAERALEAGFDTHVWQIAWALSRFLDTRGRWHDWAVIEQIALAATQRLGDRAAQASAHQRFGYASARLGCYEDAHAHLGRALSIHTELGDHAGQAYVHNSLAITLTSQGRHGEALGQAQQALKSYTAAGDGPGRALALNSVGWFHAVLGDHRRRSATAGSLSTCSATSAAGKGSQRAGQPRVRPPAARQPRPGHCLLPAGTRPASRDRQPLGRGRDPRPPRRHPPRRRESGGGSDGLGRGARDLG